MLTIEEENTKKIKLKNLEHRDTFVYNDSYFIVVWDDTRNSDDFILYINLSNGTVVSFDNQDCLVQQTNLVMTVKEASNV